MIVYRYELIFSIDVAPITHNSSQLLVHSYQKWCRVYAVIDENTELNRIHRLSTAQKPDAAREGCEVESWKVLGPKLATRRTQFCILQIYQFPVQDRYTIFSQSAIGRDATSLTVPRSLATFWIIACCRAVCATSISVYAERELQLFHSGPAPS